MNKKNSNIFKSIFQNYDTDKTENFSDAYENHFTPIRNDVHLIFEIGVNRGGSARAWKEFFPNAIIVGIDIGQHTYFEEDRIHIEIGDASKKEIIHDILQKYGDPDIVIDDGSHFSEDIKQSFRYLYNHTKFCYVIEDYGTQNKDYSDGFYITDGEPATNILFDKINDLLLNNESCKSVHVYYSIAFIMQQENRTHENTCRDSIP